MATQTALALTEIGKPLIKVTTSIPSPNENELLIKLTASGLTPLDWKFRETGILGISEQLPAIIVSDLVGIIISAGPNTSLLYPIGTHVFSQALTFSAGGLQEYAIISSEHLARVPENISDEDAALFPINAFTSMISLFGNADVGAKMPFPRSAEAEGYSYGEQKIVIVGGGTMCGKLAVMMARLAGVGTIVAVAGLGGEKELRAFGATHIVDRNASGIREQVRAIIGDECLMIYDTISEGDHSLGVSLLSNNKKGLFVHLLPGEVDEEVVKSKQAGFVARQSFGVTRMHPDFARKFWKVFPGWIEKEEIKVLEYGVIEGLDAEAVNGALDGYGEGKGNRWCVKF